MIGQLSIEEWQSLEAAVRAHHESIARHCWKHHWQNFNVCEDDACQLLRELATLLKWKVSLNGVIPPNDPRFNDPAW